MRYTLALILALAAGCTVLPASLDSAETPEARVAPYPALAPLDGLPAPAADAAAGEAATRAVDARGAALRARAAALRRLPAP